MTDRDRVASLYSALSRGEKSCIAAMLSEQDAVQLTSADSGHGRFYEHLEKLGWAHPDDVNPKPAELGTLRAWRLTPLGYRKLPFELLAISVRSDASGLEPGRAHLFLGFAGKLMLCYAAVQGLLALALILVSRLGLAMPGAGTELSILGLVVALICGLYMALGNWAVLQRKNSSLRHLAYLIFSYRNSRGLSIVAGLSILIIHLGFETAITAYGHQAGEKSILKLAIQGIALAIAASVLTSYFLPGIASSRTRSFINGLRKN